MTIWSQKLSRFTAVLVSLGLLLGLTVTGCSEKDREGGQVTEVANVSYHFTQTSTTSKANLDATTVVLDAFDGEGSAVTVAQDTQVIAEHEDITPAELVGSKVYAGSAQVDLTAVKLVLSYFNAEGEKVATADVLEDVTIKDGSVIDFTAIPSVNWFIYEKPLHGSDIIMFTKWRNHILATDDNGEALTVNLAIEPSSSDISIIDTDKIQIADTLSSEVATAEVVATATNSEGKVLAEQTFHVSAYTNDPTIVWTPAEERFFLHVGESLTFTATDATGSVDYNVGVLPDYNSEFIAPDGNTITAIAETQEFYEYVIARDSNGKVVGYKLFNLGISE